MKVWCGGEFSDFSETDTSSTLQLESTCILFLIWDKFLGSWIFNRHFKYCTFHFHEKHKAVCTGKFGAHDETLQRARGLEGNISIVLCVVLFVTSHSAAIGKELNHSPVGLILRTIYGLFSICWPIINYVDFRLTSKPISIFLNISQSYLAY